MTVECPHCHKLVPITDELTKRLESIHKALHDTLKLETRALQIKLEEIMKALPKK